MDAALENTLLSGKIERMHLEIEREMDRASNAAAEVVRLREALRDIQWKTICGGMGQSSYPTCVGCGIVSHGTFSTPPHQEDCPIETALRPKAAEATAAEQVQGEC